MKVKYSFALFIFCAFLGSCFDAPEFPTTPKIRFERVCFGKSSNEFRPDSVVVTVSFEDGDGDIGVDPGYREEPFHELNYFVANDGELTPVGKKTLDPRVPRFLSIPPTLNGELTVKSTRLDPDYFNKMVAYNADSACLYYRIDSVLLKTADKRLLPPGTNFYEIPYLDPLGDPEFNSIVVVKDTFYVEKNPQHQTIEVRFYQKAQDPNDPSKIVFKYINWDKIFCTEIFDARFPGRLSDKNNALSGTIRYSMRSTELETVLGSFIWKLRIRIRDRAGNVSNAVWSQEFTLDEIRGCFD